MVKITSNFISEIEENELLYIFKPRKLAIGFGRNKVMRYGSNLPYNAPMVSRELPPWSKNLIDKLIKDGYLQERPDHITVNEYQKGQAIDWHTDSKKSGDIITVLSLKTKAIMGLKDENGVETKVELEPRSLVQMTDKERWGWKHCIFPVEDLRFSVVFRKGTHDTSA